MKSILFLPLLAASLFTAQAASVIYELNTVVVSDVQPNSVSPWATVTIDPIDSNSVKFTIESQTIGYEFVSAIGLNLSDSYVFNTVPLFDNFTSTGSFVAPTVSFGDNIKSGGAGTKYDVWFEFAPNASGRFTSGDSVSYTINGISIDSFQAGANPIVAHIQGINQDQSSWVGSSVNATTVPEPSTMLIGALGGFFLLTRRKR